MINPGTSGHFAAIARATPKPELGVQDHTTSGDPHQLAHRSRGRRLSMEEQDRARRRSPLGRTLWVCCRLLMPLLVLSDLAAWLGRWRAKRAHHALPRAHAAPRRHALDGRGRLGSRRDQDHAGRHRRRQRRLKLALYAMCVIPFAAYIGYAIRHGADAIVPGVRGGPMRVGTWIWVYGIALAMLLTYDLSRLLCGRGSQGDARPAAGA